MQISFHSYSTNFGNSQSYNMGFNHGKNDGLNGSRSIIEFKEDEKISKPDYEDGYNAGYKTGKTMRVDNKVTVTDVIQDLIEEGMPKNRAIEFAASYFGGW